MDRPSRNPPLLAAALLLLAGPLGCARWTTLETVPPNLPAPRMSHDAVALEMAVVALPATAAGSDPLPAVWRQVDEQTLPPDLRRRLADNGCRAGILGGAIPTELRALLDREAEPENQLLPPQARSLPCRDGRRQELAVAPRERELVLLTCLEGKVRGQTYSEGQGLLVLRAHPLPDGRVRLELTPEIQHGEPKQRFAGREGMFLIEASRPRQPLDALRLEVELAPGQTFVMTGVETPSGLGQHLFHERETGERRLLLLRLAQTQQDGLFSQNSLAPVVTPGD